MDFPNRRPLDLPATLLPAPGLPESPLSHSVFKTMSETDAVLERFTWLGDERRGDLAARHPAPKLVLQPAPHTCRIPGRRSPHRTRALPGLTAPAAPVHLPTGTNRLDRTRRGAILHRYFCPSIYPPRVWTGQLTALVTLATAVFRARTHRPIVRALPPVIERRAGCAQRNDPRNPFALLHAQSCRATRAACALACLRHAGLWPTYRSAPGAADDLHNRGSLPAFDTPAAHVQVVRHDAVGVDAGSASNARRLLQQTSLPSIRLRCFGTPPQSLSHPSATPLAPRRDVMQAACPEAYSNSGSLTICSPYDPAFLATPKCRSGRRRVGRALAI